MIYEPRIVEIGRPSGVSDDEIKGRPLIGKHGHDECERGYCEAKGDAANLRATVSTLLGRIEALERTVAAMREREQAVRRAIGQLASACDIVRK